MRVRNNSSGGNGDRRQPQLGMSRRGRPQQQHAKRPAPAMAAGEAMMMLVVRAKPQEEEGAEDPGELRLELTEPQPGEECCITMEPIAEHVPEWLPERAGSTTATKREPLVEGGSPRLTKATLPCGHGFNALAVLYHFARNEMTCPCCRQGLPRQRMALGSVPQWAREPMQARLERAAVAEREEQVAADATAVARLLEAEAARERGFADRRVLSLYAYTSAEALVPALVQEVPLTMMAVRDDGAAVVEFATDAVGALEISRNMRLMPIPLVAFEAVVTMRVGDHGVYALARSVRFAAPAQGGGAPMTVACLGHGPEVHMRVSATNGGGFERISVQMPQEALPMLLLQSALAEPVLLDTPMTAGGVMWNAPEHEEGDEDGEERLLLLRAAAEEARLWDRRRNELYYIMVD